MTFQSQILTDWPIRYHCPPALPLLHSNVLRRAWTRQML
jgi:hypothetical protein